MRFKILENIWDWIMSWFSKASMPSLKQGETLAGYGRPNSWLLDNAILKEEIEYCGKNNVKLYPASLLSWWRYHGKTLTEDQKKRMVGDAYEVLIKACRKYGVIVLLDIHNQNAGSGKWGERGRKLNDQREIKLINWGIQLVKSFGPENVILIPIRETSTSYGRQIEKYIKNNMPEFVSCSNNESRTWPVPQGYDYAEWHPWTVSDRPPVPTIVTTDTGRIIRQIFGVFDGKLFTGKANKDMVYAWGYEMRRMKQYGAVIYAHSQSGPVDKEAIKAIGDSTK